MAGPIAAIAMDILRNRMQQDPEQYRDREAVVEQEKPPLLTPQRMHLLGGLADAASTYYMTKRGTRQEGDPLVGRLGSPETMGLGLVGQLAATRGLAALIRKKYPKVADALEANKGGMQIGLAAENVQSGPRPAALDSYTSAIDRATTMRRK